MSITHKPKAGALLTGTEYEAADSHSVSLNAADVGAGEPLTVKDEGVDLDTAVTSIDVVGPDLTATNVGHAITITNTPKVYVSASDPGAVGAGKLWIDDQAGDDIYTVRVRNSADDAWVPVLAIDRSGVYQLFGADLDNSFVQTGMDSTVHIGGSAMVVIDYGKLTIGGIPTADPVSTGQVWASDGVLLMSGATLPASGQTHPQVLARGLGC